MPDNSVDSIVTDPPYELGFMGKSWDSSGIAFNVDVWTEALRVLKPGGHLIAFSGSRTYHRMAVAIEDAGFEIRDQIMWIYGSGFPKSLDISKAIDKAAGAEREVVGEKVTGRALGGSNWKDGDAGGQEMVAITAPSTESAKQWQGWGTALKPAHEPMVLARKPIVGTVANNVLTYGVGGLNIDGSRVAHQSEADRASATPQGKVTSNLSAEAAPDVDNAGRVEVSRPDTSLGRWPANIIHDGSWEVVELFPDTAGNHGDRVATSKFEFGAGDGSKISATNAKQDFGTAARFFYCAKASKRDRNEGLDEEFQAKKSDTQDAVAAGLWEQMNAAHKNHHPTVKPTDLMRYLCKLVTPPNGTVLDPFMGSGSTGKAAILDGFDFIGIEQSEEYIKIAEARINWVKKNQEKTLF